MTEYYSRGGKSKGYGVNVSENGRDLFRRDYKTVRMSEVASDVRTSLFDLGVVYPAFEVKADQGSHPESLCIRGNCPVGLTLDHFVFTKEPADEVVQELSWLLHSLRFTREVGERIASRQFPE